MKTLEFRCDDDHLPVSATYANINITENFFWESHFFTKTKL